MTKVEKYIQSLLNEEEYFYPLEISSSSSNDHFDYDHYHTIKNDNNRILGFKINHNTTCVTYIVIKNNIQKSFDNFKKALLYFNN